MSSAGLEHGGQGDRHECGSSLVAERQEWSCLVRSSLGLPSYTVAGAAVGAGCARVPPVSHDMEAFGRMFSNVACHAALFALRNLDISTLLSYLSAYSGVWVLLVEYSVLYFSGDPACTSLGSTVNTCFEGFGRIYIFSTLR